MEATINIRESQYEDVSLETYKTFFGGLKTRRVSRGTKACHILELTIMPTEEERAIILKYKLDELAVETEAKYTPERLEEMEAEQRSMFGRDSETVDAIVAGTMAELRSMKDQTLLGQYFDNPYTRNFDLRQDAHTYADKLEKEVLPLIKTQIDYCRLESMRRDKRTITL
jgi:hypothetical protein